MTLPTDIASFAMGFDLKAANYSTPGVGAGVFANLVPGEDAWQMGSDVPSFSTKSGLEGMDFVNSINSQIQGRMRAMSEFTVLAIAQVASTSSRYILGNRSASNQSALWTSAGELLCYGNGFFDGATTPGVVNNTTFVGCGSWSPVNQTLYVQRNAGAVATDAAWLGVNPSTFPHWQAAIGGMNTSYWEGWIARVLIFSRALHYRDNTNLQALIATEMASVGL